MSNQRLTVLVVGATGSIGRLVVEEALKRGLAVRALARDPGKGRRLFPDAQVVAGDLTHPESLTSAVASVDALVFTHGSDGGGKAGSERIDYGGVRNVLAALGDRSVRIALMTAIGVTNREGDYNRQTEATTGTAAASGSCAPAGCRTRSCDPAGSTTTSQMNIDSYSSRATAGTPEIRAMGSSHVANSLRCWWRA
jgi:nucleoside-diphosphate-sugar epimerase